jgi:hypothetical protein
MTKTIPAHAGRIAGRVWLALRWFWAQLDWELIGYLVSRGIVTFAVILYLLGKGLGTAAHKANDAISARWVALWVRPEADHFREVLEMVPAPESIAKPTPNQRPIRSSPPAVAPLFEDLAHLSVRQLRELTGVRSKRFRRAELLAMVAA